MKEVNVSQILVEVSRLLNESLDHKTEQGLRLSISCLIAEFDRLIEVFEEEI